MISKKNLDKIREYLDISQNPLFFFDNDQDGLCSYLLLRRFLGRGKGVPVKSNPLDKEYFRKVIEFTPDYIFILDVPEISLEFFQKVEELNIPIVWIDHHDIPRLNFLKKINYFNSFSKKSKKGESVTSICYKITNRKEDLWIGVAGAISDREFPVFYKDFFKIYPDLGINSKDAFEIFYNSRIGKISRLFGAGLKDRTTNVMNMIKFIINSKSPYELLNKSKENSIFYERFEELEKKLNSLVEKAKLNYSGGKTLFLKYAGDTSMSADLSNRLSHIFPGRIIVVAYLKGNFVNLSLRGEDIKEKVLEIIQKIENARGGGHPNAVGIQMHEDKLDFFVEEIKNIFG